MAELLHKRMERKFREHALDMADQAHQYLMSENYIDALTCLQEAEHCVREAQKCAEHQPPVRALVVSSAEIDAEPGKPLSAEYWSGKLEQSGLLPAELMDHD